MRIRCFGGGVNVLAALLVSAAWIPPASAQADRAMDAAFLADPFLPSRVAGPLPPDDLRIFHVLDARSGKARFWFQIPSSDATVGVPGSWSARVVSLPPMEFDGLPRLVVLREEGAGVKGRLVPRIVTPLRRGDPAGDPKQGTSAQHLFGPGILTVGPDSDLHAMHAAVSKAPRRAGGRRLFLSLCETVPGEPDGVCRFSGSGRFGPVDGPIQWSGGGKNLGLDVQAAAAWLGGTAARGTLAVVVDLLRTVPTQGATQLVRPVHVEKTETLEEGRPVRLDLTPPHWTRPGRLLLEIGLLP